MKILTYSSEKKAGILAEALVTLMAGGTVVYPTETAYALGADFFSPHAYRDVYRIKRRGTQKALPVIVPTFEYATTIVAFSPKASALALQYWPGPLTLVVPFRYHSEWPHHADEYLALRVSSHPFAADLAKALGKPLIATSANVSGSAPLYDVENIVSSFSKQNEKPDLIIDFGALPVIAPSTIIKDDKGALSIMRKGALLPSGL